MSSSPRKTQWRQLTSGQPHSRRCLLALARYDNVGVKFPGVPARYIEPYLSEDIWPVCHRILESFGPKRLMWGSDFRRIRTLRPYAAVDCVELTHELSHHEKQMVLATSLRNWIGWS